MEAPASRALLTTTAADEVGRNQALARFSAVGIGGGALGLLLGGALTQYASWRWTLLVNVPQGLGVLLAVPYLISETPRQRERTSLEQPWPSPRQRLSSGR